MANLKADEEYSGKLEELERAERVATEYGRAVDDLLYRTVRELAETRAGLRLSEKRRDESSSKLNRSQWNERRLVERIMAALDWIHADHFRRLPSHKRAPAPAARKGCKACQLIIQIQQDVAEFGKELAR